MMSRATGAIPVETWESSTATVAGTSAFVPIAGNTSAQTVHKMNALKYIRDRYGVEAHQGGRIIYGKEKPIGGRILGGKNGRLRVRLDGGKRTVLLHPLWKVTYLPTSAKTATDEVSEPAKTQ